MRTIRLIIIMLLIATGISYGQKRLAGRHKISLQDPAGDVLKQEGKPGKDVTGLSIVSDGSTLTITAILDKNVSYYLKDQMAGPVVEMHFNTDNNVRTGGIAFWGTDKKGFEYELDLVACIRYKNGGLAALGSLGGEIAGYCSSYKLGKYAQDKKMPENINNVLDCIQNDIEGKEVSVTIPYDLISIRSGTRMMISIRESDGSFDNGSYFPEVFFIVK